MLKISEKRKKVAEMFGITFLGRIFALSNNKKSNN